MPPNSSITNTFSVIELVSFVIIGTISLLILFAYPFSVSFSPSSISANWGDFGALFGGVASSSIAAIALFVLIKGVKFQHAEIKLARHEIEQLREQFALQTELSTRQHFDESFSILLNSYTEQSSKFQITINRVMHSGKRAFAIAADGIASRDKSEQEISDGFKGRYNKFEPELGPYFGVLLNVFKVIHDKSYDIKFHSNIIKSQLSQNEVLLICVFSKTDTGREFKNYIEEYSLLENLSTKLRKQLGVGLLDKFDPKAFGSRPLHNP